MKFTIDRDKLHSVVKGAKATGRPEAVIWLKDDRWLMKCISKSDVVMFGAAITDKVMDDYERGDMDELGIGLDKMDSFLASRNDDKVTVELIETKAKVHKLELSCGNSGIGIPVIAPEYVEGKAQQAPDIDYCVSFTGDIKFLTNFVKESDNVVGSSSFMISPREGLMYLYSVADDTDNWERKHWEDFDDYSIDWSKGFYEADHYKNPEEDHAVDSMLSVDWFKGIELISDEGTVFVDNHAPVKILFDTEEGMKASYFVSPRIAADGEVSRLPNRIVKDRSL